MKLLYIIIFIVFQSMSCVSLKLLSSNFIIEELKWKKEWINMFFNEYSSYEENYLINCHDKERSVSFDIERKLRAINQFSFNIIFSELRNYFVSNPLEFDSLIMQNTHRWYNEEEFNFAPVSFYLCNKGEVCKLIAYFDADQRPTIKKSKEDPKEVDKHFGNLVNGCGYGFITLTKFNRDLSSWRINRIIINPNE